MLRLTVVSGVFNRRAAADKLPCSTTVRKVDIASRRSIESPSIVWKNIFRFCHIAPDFGRPASLASEPGSPVERPFAARKDPSTYGPLLRRAVQSISLDEGV